MFTRKKDDDERSRNYMTLQVVLFVAGSNIPGLNFRWLVGGDAEAYRIQCCKSTINYNWCGEAFWPRSMAGARVKLARQIAVP
jgi:hypothetical protein